jgi:hypothetical protein
MKVKNNICMTRFLSCRLDEFGENMIANDQDNSHGLEINPSNVQTLFTKVEQKAHLIHEGLVTSSQYTGYICEVIHKTGEFYYKLALVAEDKPELLSIVASGVNFVNSLDRELTQIQTLEEPIIKPIQAVAFSSVAFCSTSGSISNTLFPTYGQLDNFDEPIFFSPDENKVESQLSKIDPQLVAPYREIGQVLHGTTSDPARAAMGLMRQVVDHLLSVLAPDEAVRTSPYWKPKNDKQADMIYRKERMKYAVYTHISNKAKADTIFALFDTFMESYQLLNKFHKRGEINKRQADSALRSIKSFIIAWLEAMEQ